MEKEELSVVINNPKEGDFLKEIKWNREEFIELVASITEQYEGLTYTDEQIKAAKEDRAKLNAMKKAVSDRRIEVKKAVMAPYTKFEEELAEVIALIEKPIETIDIQIKEYEKKVKQEKEQALVEHFKEVGSELDGILTFDMIYDKKWLNASVSLKKAKDEIEEKVSRITTDLKTIESMCMEKYHAIIKDYYIKTLDISKALEEERRLKELDQKLEEEKQRKEEARLKAEQEAERKVVMNEETDLKTEETVPESPESVSNLSETAQIPDGVVQKAAENDVVPPIGDVTVTDTFAQQEDTKQYKASFTIFGTKAEIMAVKQYMIDNNIKFGKVEK